MASATTTGTANYGELTTEQRAFYEMMLLERAVPNFLHVFFGLEGSVRPVTTLPENKGATIQWNKLLAFEPATTPLEEAVNPDPEDITVTTVTGTVQEYGAFIRYTKNLAEYGIHKIAAEAADALGEQAGESLDLIVRSVLVAETSNVQYADKGGDGNSATNQVASDDVLTFAEIMQALATLRTEKAVAPMNGKFPVILHPKAIYDLYNDSVFQNVMNYAYGKGNDNPYITGYVGDAFGMSFYESPNAYVDEQAGASSIDVYSTLILGKGAFGVGGLAAYMPQVIREDKTKTNKTFEKVRPLRLIDKAFGSTGVADPFDRLASMAWYTTFVTVILNASFYVRIEHAVTLN